MPIPEAHEDDGEYDFVEDTQETVFQDLQLDANDEAALAMFAHQPTSRTLDLGSLIMAKIQQHEAQAGLDAEALMRRKFNSKVVEVYKG